MAGAFEHDVFSETFPAGADYSSGSGQFLAVELATDGSVSVCNGATDLVIGILQDKPYTGQAGRVQIMGIARWKSDGSGTAIAIGDRVGTNNAGKCVKKATDADLVAGIALAASSADGTIIPVLLTPGAQRAS